MKKLLLAAALAATITPAFAAENYRTWTGPELLSYLNGECRGGSGDDAATMRACDERNLVDAALFADGYCFSLGWGPRRAGKRPPFAPVRFFERPDFGTD
jgi:hypothetical protein